MIYLLASNAATCQYRHENCHEPPLPITGYSIGAVLLIALVFVIVAFVIRGRA